MAKLYIALLGLVGFASAANMPTVLLQNAVVDDNVRMPAVGLGTGGYGAPAEVWNNTVAYQATKLWLAEGGRYLDCALSYNTQVGIARAIKESGIPRDDLWITSKVPAGGTIAAPIPVNATTHPYEATLASFALVQQQLQVKQVDLLLIHWPYGPTGAGLPFTPAQYRQAAWKALEHILATGGARAIGVSNYEVKHLQDLEALGGKLPAVDQVEFHPYYHEDALVSYCKGKGIQFDAYSPLGTADVVNANRYWTPSCLENAQIKRVAAAHPGFSAAQVVLAWLWGQGLVTHPRTESAAHMRENLNAAGTLTLTAAEMATISRGLAVPDCSSGPQKGTTCPTAVAKPARGCCKICPLTTTIP